MEENPRARADPRQGAPVAPAADRDGPPSDEQERQWLRGRLMAFGLWFTPATAAVFTVIVGGTAGVASGRFDTVVAVVGIGLPIGLIVGVLVGVMAGAFAGVADALLAPRVPRSVQWAPATVGVALAVTPWWISYGRTVPGAAVPVVTGELVVVTGLFLVTFGVVSARWHRIGSRSTSAVSPPVSGD